MFISSRSWGPGDWEQSLEAHLGSSVTTISITASTVIYVLNPLAEVPSLGLSTLGRCEHSRRVQIFSPKYSAFSLCLDWTTQAGALCRPIPQPYFPDQGPNRPAGQRLASLPPQPFWDQAEPRPHRGNQENLPPSLSRTQVWNLVGVGEDTVLGQNRFHLP